MKWGVFMKAKRLEAKRLIHILNKSDEVYCIGKESDRELAKILKSEIVITQFDKPDIIFKIDEKNLLLEQFQFDSAARDGKSSSQKKDSAEAKRNIDEAIANNENQEVVTVNYEYRMSANLNDYESNLLRSFDSHSDKLSLYIENYINYAEDLTRKGIYNNIYELGFVIEDTTLLPNVMVTKTNDRYLLTPFHLNKFKERLTKEKNLKHIFFITNTQDGFVIYYYYNSETNSISGFEIDNDDYLIPLKPNLISSSAKIY